MCSSVGALTTVELLQIYLHLFGAETVRALAMGSPIFLPWVRKCISTLIEYSSTKADESSQSERTVLLGVVHTIAEILALVMAHASWVHLERAYFNYASDVRTLAEMTAALRVACLRFEAWILGANKT